MYKRLTDHETSTEVFTHRREGLDCCYAVTVFLREVIYVFDSEKNQTTKQMTNWLILNVCDN